MTVPTMLFDLDVLIVPNTKKKLFRILKCVRYILVLFISTILRLFAIKNNLEYQRYLNF